MLHSYHVTVGLESPAWSEEECRQHALGLADDYFPEGYTVVDAQGRWASPERGPIQEASLIFIFTELDDNDPYLQRVHKFATVYKTVACQDAVLVQPYQCAKAQLV